MKVNALYYIQGNSNNKQEYYSTVLNFKLLDQISTTLIYGDDEYGYQRKLNQKHYKKIAKSIQESELISPTSIVLGVNKSYVNEIINHIEDNIYTLNLSSTTTEKFRIIDGQHRINGLKEARKKDPQIDSYNLSVIIMVIDDDKRRVEAKVFKDINSKAKPLKMDLAILALYKYDILEQVREIDIREHVGIKIAYLLNEKNPIWKNAIALDVNGSNINGCVGFKTFYESIKSICTIYIEEKEIDDIKDKSFEEILSFVDRKSNEIVNEIIEPCWEIVRDRWPSCFLNNSIILYNFEEFEIMFNKKYYIQKTMGCKAINGLISEVLLNNNSKDIEDSIIIFKKMIFVSEVSDEDWKVGKRFSALSSEAGFKKIRSIIKNELNY